MKMYEMGYAIDVDDAGMMCFDKSPEPLVSWSYVSYLEEFGVNWIPRYVTRQSPDLDANDVFSSRRVRR